MILDHYQSHILGIETDWSWNALVLDVCSCGVSWYGWFVSLVLVLVIVFWIVSGLLIRYRLWNGGGGLFNWVVWLTALFNVYILLISDVHNWIPCPSGFVLAVIVVSWMLFVLFCFCFCFFHWSSKLERQRQSSA